MLSWLFFNVALLANNPPQYRRLDGSWYHGVSDNWIEIRDEGRYISVMGLPPHGKARIFEQEWKGIYRDKKGNKITIETKNTLFYHHRKSGHVIEFYRPLKHHPSSDNYDRGSSHPSHHGPQPRHYPDQGYGAADNLEGTWAAEGSIDIAMVKTRDGLKAKYGGTTRWVSYQIVNNKDDEFIDENGNRYVFHHSTSATWYPKDHRNKPIHLKKISDDVKY